MKYERRSILDGNSGARFSDHMCTCDPDVLGCSVSSQATRSDCTVPPCMKILVVTEGTIIDDRQQDVKWKLFGHAAAKLTAWHGHGATIAYLSSKKKTEDLERVRIVLKEGGAPKGELWSRSNDEDYGQVAMRASPDVMVEDDYKSIGGEKEMVWVKLPTEQRARIKSVIVPEFGGIDHLPNDAAELFGISRSAYAV